MRAPWSYRVAVVAGYPQVHRAFARLRAIRLSPSQTCIHPPFSLPNAPRAVNAPVWLSVQAPRRRAATTTPTSRAAAAQSAAASTRREASLPRSPSRPRSRWRRRCRDATASAAAAATVTPIAAAVAAQPFAGGRRRPSGRTAKAVAITSSVWGGEEGERGRGSASKGRSTQSEGKGMDWKGSTGETD